MFTHPVLFLAWWNQQTEVRGAVIYFFIEKWLITLNFKKIKNKKNVGIHWFLWPPLVPSEMVNGVDVNTTHYMVINGIRSVLRLSAGDPARKLGYMGFGILIL